MGGKVEELIVEKIEDLVLKLIEKYSKKYPHNPNGVIKFHLDKLIGSGASFMEGIIRLAYENGVKLKLIEELMRKGLSIDDAVKEAAQKFSHFEDTVRSMLGLLRRRSIEELEEDELMKYYMKLIKKIIITTTPTIPGHRIVRVLGPVSGLTIRSRGLGGTITATIESFVGGELKSLTIEFEKARLEAIARMVDKALKMGANAVIGLDFETSDIFGGAAIAVSAYGTAVVIERENKGGAGIVKPIGS